MITSKKIIKRLKELRKSYLDKMLKAAYSANYDSAAKYKILAIYLEDIISEFEDT